MSFDNLNWRKARKKPIIVEYAELDKPCVIQTLEGRLYAHPKDEFIIRGIKGEFYPIRKDIFYETYNIIHSSEGTSNDSDKLRSMHGQPCNESAIGRKARSNGMEIREP